MAGVGGGHCSMAGTWDLWENLWLHTMGKPWGLRGGLKMGKPIANHSHESRITDYAELCTRNDGTSGFYPFFHSDGDI